MLVYAFQTILLPVKKTRECENDIYKQCKEQQKKPDNGMNCNKMKVKQRSTLHYNKHDTPYIDPSLVINYDWNVKNATK